MVWLCLKNTHENFKDIGFSIKRFTTHAILIGSAVALLTLAFMQLIFFPVLDYFIPVEASDASIYDFIRENKWQYLIMVVMGWIVGGFYEEIVFHGFIFTRLELLFKGKYATKLSFVMTAIIFGVYHYQLGIFDMINALLVGAVYLGLFLYYKRNLWYSIICHGVYNTIVITLLYLGYF
ncbi:MAG: hypothetical protein BM564_00745 [Bacteroidetes bacterium MedPE-SWsnd-G2]|nr:MAG: hypothetical protein BM564_00745 [Bacteroidetes bacterium MedPE-SWsnd-G2]